MHPPHEKVDRRRLKRMASDALVWVHEPLAFGEALPLAALVEFLDYVPLHRFALACAAPLREIIGYARWFRAYVNVIQEEMGAKVFPLLTINEQVLKYFRYFGTDLWAGLFLDQITSPLKKPSTARRIFELAAQLHLPLYLRVPLQPGRTSEAYYRLIAEFQELTVVLVPNEVSPTMMRIWGQNDNVWLSLADLRTSEMHRLPRDFFRVIYGSGFPKGLRLVDHFGSVDYSDLGWDDQSVTEEMEDVYALHRNFCAHWFGEKIFSEAFDQVFGGKPTEPRC